MQNQMDDNELRPLIAFLKNGSLPTDENAARELAVNKKQHVLLDDVLYHTITDGTICIT